MLFRKNAMSAVMGIILVLPSVAYAQPQWALQSVSGPSPRAGHDMVYDSCRGVFVLFGGFDTSQISGETWEWNGIAWTLRLANGVGPRHWHAMAFDATRGVTVLFGGNDAAGNYLNDTWEWDGSSWTQKCTGGCTRPPTRNGASMAYDSIHQVVLLFGGYSPGLRNDTWKWDGTIWTQVTATSPPSPRTQVAMAYDPDRDRVVVWGGKLNAAGPCGGVFSDETWELDLSKDPATWTQIATSTQPGPRYSLRMVYDATRNRMVLFGGSDGCTTQYNDTWEYDGVTWVPVTVTGPPGRHAYGLGYDTAINEVLMFGGYLDPLEDSVIGDTWTYGAPPPDTDGDGIPDDEDACPESDRGESIVIDGCDTGVDNVLFPDGCTMIDLIMLCAEDANNHDQFVSCVAHLRKEWKHDGLITGAEEGAIQSCAGQAGIP